MEVARLAFAITYLSSQACLWEKAVWEQQPPACASFAKEPCKGFNIGSANHSTASDGIEKNEQLRIVSSFILAKLLEESVVNNWQTAVARQMYQNEEECWIITNWMHNCYQVH